MGDTISTTQESNNDQMEKYLDKLQFVQNIQDQFFGSIDIFRLRQSPYQYIMDYKKTFMEGDNRYTKYINCMNHLSKTQHKNLAKIHLTQLKEETHMCIKDKKTHTFCNYYNFTLMEAIKKKKQQQAIFTESQLLYIMSCLVDLAQYLRKFNISIGQYRAPNIYLSPQGYIKLYLLQIDEENRHSCYYKVLAERQIIDSYILAPQQLKQLSVMQYQVKYDIYKADLFAIAFIIFELITQDQIKFYYNQSKTNYKFDRIHFDMDAVSKIYSQNFINLLANCLAQDPKKRLTLAQAGDILSTIKKNSPQCTYCIRLHEDQGKKKVLNRKDSQQNSPKVPLGYMTKLMPSPITTLSSSSSSFKMNTGRNSADLNTGSSFNQILAKSPSLTSKTSQNETNSGLMQKFAQKKIVYKQK